ncbi:MAG: asparagine synthase (glutamine-hydrolyzing) [Chitinophagaceae bacterium]
MCGISAIVNTRNSPVENAVIRNMNAAIAHRGPDNDGVYAGPNFAIGHRRLSIMDTSHLAHQPFKYKDFIITFNGEIYNHREIKEDLQKCGYSFATFSDTEVILAAYDKWGENCVSHFEGMWAFIIFDATKNILFGSRDRFGQKPFHYGTFDSCFIIASEIKQFSQVPGFKATLNHEAAFNFLNYSGLNYSDDSLFEGITSLPSGHNMLYDLSTHKYTIRQWYYFPERRTNNIDIQEAATEFRRLFRTSVELRMGTDARLGACLSGGLDSSSIVCMMDKLINRGEHFSTLSICWDDKTIDEQEYIDAVSRHAQTAINYKIFPEMNDLNDENVLEKIIYHQDQPILSTSHFSEYKVYEAAAQKGLRVMLDGQGADEYLGGYSIFNWYHLHGLFGENRLLSLSKEWRAMRKLTGSRYDQMFKNFLFVKYKQRKPQLAAFINEKWGKKHLNENPMLPPSNARLSAKDLSYHQVFSSSLPYQLHSADRNSMCHSVESRLPFLDHQLVEFCYLLPDTLKISEATSKIVLREAMKEILPEKVRSRPTKLGFPAPERAWMRQNATWIAKEIDDSADTLQDLVCPAKLKADFQKFAECDCIDQASFFKVISFSRWLKIFGVSVK